MEMKDISSNPVTLIKVFPCSVLSEVIEAYTTFPIPLLATSPPPPSPQGIHTLNRILKNKNRKTITVRFYLLPAVNKGKERLEFFFF